MAPRMDRRSAVRRIALARVVSSTGSTAAYTALTYAIYDRTGSTTWVSVAVFVTLAANGILMPLGGLDRRSLRPPARDDRLGPGRGRALRGRRVRRRARGCSWRWPSWRPWRRSRSCRRPAPRSRTSRRRRTWPGPTAASRARSPPASRSAPRSPAASSPCVGPSLAFALNALSFVLSAAIVSTVHGQFADRDRAPDEDHGSARAGVDFVRHSAALRTIVLAEFVAFIGVGLIIVSDAPLARALRRRLRRLRPAGRGLGPRHDRRRLVGRAGAEGAARTHGAARRLAGDRGRPRHLRGAARGSG